ncbi:MAG: DUF4126 domain-containing protein [bacterium]|nr:DUF4126 domain-containing protein [bacterium]
METIEIIFALLMGFSLAATCGLRAFLPLLIISLGAKAGFITLSSGFDWMASWPAIIVFGTATILEILGDKVPTVDHILDAGGTIVRPIAGAVAASSLIQGMNPLMTMVVGIIIGATIAGIVNAIKGTVRGLSTAVTGGIANPVVSIVEDGATALTGVLSLVVPYITAVGIIVALVYTGKVVVSKFRCRKAARESTGAI